MAEQKPIPSHPRFKDLTGKTFEQLVVLYYCGRAGRHSLWFCRCNCGKACVIRGRNLRSGNSVSCGCYNRESTPRRARTHGLRHTPEYEAWANMKTRCYNSRRRSYARYGGRGIRVCERWLHSFENFLADMGRKPGPEYSLDRYPNNDGNYEPENCRWATLAEQLSNTRRNHRVTFNGETLTITEWEQKYRFPNGVIKWRLLHGWSIEEALSSGVRPGFPRRCRPGAQASSAGIS